MKLQYDPAGSTLLRICGVLMIVFGVLGILIYLLGLAAVVGITYATSGVFSASGDLIGMSLLLAGAIVELIAGILGVRSARKPARAGKALLVWGVLSLLLTLAGMGDVALRAVNSAPLWELILGLILGVVTPAVYLVGAVRLQKPLPGAEAEQPDEEPEP